MLSSAAAAISQVESGSMVSFVGPAAPEGSAYSYQWTASLGSPSSFAGQSFAWTAPLVDQPAEAMINLTVVDERYSCRCSAQNRTAVLVRPKGEPRLSSIVACQFNDKNEDARQDEGEEGLAGWEMTLQRYDQALASWTDVAGGRTGPDGCYIFVDLPAGRYRVREEVRPGWTATSGDLQPYSEEAVLSGEDDWPMHIYLGKLPQSDLTVEKTSSVRAVEITGHNPQPELAFTIKVANVGGRTLGPVMVEDRLPSGLLYRDSSPPAESSGDAVVWNLGSLEPSEFREVVLRVAVDPSICEGGTGDLDPSGQERLTIMADAGASRMQELILRLSMNRTRLEARLSSMRRQQELFDRSLARESLVGVSIRGLNYTSRNYTNQTSGETLSLLYNSTGGLVRTEYVRPLKGDSLLTEYGPSGLVASELYFSQVNRESLHISYHQPGPGYTTVTVTDYSTGDTLIAVLDMLGNVVSQQYKKTPGMRLLKEIPLTNCVRAYVSSSPEGGEATVEKTACQTVMVSCQLQPQGRLAVTKVPSVRAARPGQTVTYTYALSNPGDDPVYDVVVKDDRLGIINRLPISELGAGETSSQALTAQYTVKETDESPLKNCVIATGLDRNGGPVSSETVCAEVDLIKGAPRFTKAVMPKMARSGDQVTYTITFSTEDTVYGATIVDEYPEMVSFVSANVTPARGNNVWYLGDSFGPGTFTVQIVAEVAENAGNAIFDMTGSVRGTGYVNVRSSLSTEPVHLLNRAVAIYRPAPELPEERLVASADLQVGPPRTSALVKEHGSGSYQAEDEIGYRLENRTIRWNRSLNASYSPTTFALAGNRSLSYASRWAQVLKSRNYNTMASLSEEYRQATSLSRDSSLTLNENQSSLELYADFEGEASLGVAKYSNQSGPATSIRRQGLEAYPVFESGEDYAGSFWIRETIREQGQELELEKESAGMGQVSVNRQIRESQRSYEHGAGSYQADEKIETQASYMAKNMQAKGAPSARLRPGSFRADVSPRWGEGTLSRTAASFIGERFDGAEVLNVETEVSGLNEMQTRANFTGWGEFRAVSRTKEEGRVKEVDVDQQLWGSYEVQRKIMLAGISRYDLPHLSLSKEVRVDLANSSYADYTIRVKNDGNVALGPVYVRDLFPPGTDYVSSSLRPAELASDYANWTLVHLGVGQSSTIQLRLNVGRETASLVNRVDALGAYGDQFVTARNFSAVKIDWLACCPPQISAAKAARADPDDPRTIIYRISLTNRESYPMVAFVVDELPPGMRLVDSSLEPSFVGSGKVTWTVNDLLPGQTLNIDYRAQVLQDGIYVNTARVEAYSVDGPDAAFADISARAEVGNAVSSAPQDGWQPPACFGLNVTSTSYGSDWAACDACSQPEPQALIECTGCLV